MESNQNQDVSRRLIFAVRDGKLERVRELINSFGLSYSKAWSNGYVLLREAVENNHSAVAKLLLTSGSPVNSRNKTPSNTPLHFAAINGDLEIVGMLLGKHCNVNVQNNDGETPLHNAIRRQNMEVTELLLKHGADVNARDKDGTSPLHDAVLKSCLQTVDHLLKYGAYVNCECTSWRNKGYTPLHFAAGGSTEVIMLLLSRGANINASAKDDITPLLIATQGGHEASVKLLLQHGAKVDNQDKNGKTILHIAVERRNLKIVEDVLKYCPDINNQSNKDSLKTAVYGYYNKEYKKIIEALLEYGIKVSPEDSNNPELLHAAVEKGYLKIVEDLLKSGANINMSLNSTYKKGFTPLHNATKNKQEEIAKLLLSYGADINVRDGIGNTPIFYAIKNNDLKMTKLLLTNGANVTDNPDLLNTAVGNLYVEIVETLLQHDVDINANDKYGRTALYFTAASKSDCSLGLFKTDPDINIREKIAKHLLTKGANVDAQTEDGVTTLHLAIKNGYAKVVETLLEYNTNLYPGVKSDIIPLHISAEKGNEEITIMLLNKGSNVNAKQKDGTTALHVASQKGHENIVKVLLECGAIVDSKIIKSDITPLHLAAEKGHQKIIEIILKFRAHINSKDEQGRTALHIASQEGHEEVVATLLEYGSDVNITTRNNRTPLDSAIAGKQIQLDDFYKMRRFRSQRDCYSDDDYDDFDDGRFYVSCEKVVEALENHIVKMVTANLYVCKKNLLSINNCAKLRALECECEEEITRMKSETINNANISFHDVLAKGTSSLAVYMRNENIVEVLKSDDYKSKFPMYASMIKSHFRMGMKRKELLEKCSEIFHFFFDNFHLPYNCTEKIFTYLSDEELSTFKEE